MAESIALGMRLATADELATVAGVEGEISVTEGEWRAVVHDGVTKGGYPLAKLAEAGYSLTKSEDGTKLQLKNKNGVVLSETDAPAGSGGSGVHVGNDAPADENADIWLDLDDDAPTVDIDTSNLVTKTGDRGLLAGYEQCQFVFGFDEETQDMVPQEVTINANSPDTTFVFGLASVTVEDPELKMDEVNPDDPAPQQTSWTKVVEYLYGNPEMTLSDSWSWVGGVAPVFTFWSGIIVLHWSGLFGTAAFISTSES